MRSAPRLEALPGTLCFRILATMDKVRLEDGLEPTGIVVSTEGAQRLVGECGGMWPSLLWGLPLTVDRQIEQARVTATHVRVVE